MRFITLRGTDPYTFQCLHEVFTASASAPVFLLEQPGEHVTIGRNAIVGQVAHTDFCKANNIPIVRTSYLHGSSQYYGQALKGMIATVTDEELAERITRSLMASLNNLGLAVSYIPKSGNITIGGKKVSAVVSRVDQNVLLFAFSLLIDFDYAKAEQAIISKKNMRQNLTTIKKELGRDVTIDEVKIALRQGFNSILGVDVNDELTEDELSKVEEVKKKYQSELWTKYGKWSPVRDYQRPE